MTDEQENELDKTQKIFQDLKDFEKTQKIFQTLFDREKAQGHTDGEAALRVICAVNAEKNSVTKRFHAEAITDETFASEMHVLHRIYGFAAEVWNKSPESTAEGWKA
jgi:hypothetical protein